MAAINGIIIPDNTVWVDEFDWSAVNRQETTTINGGLIIQYSENDKGRPVTLDLGWVTRAILSDLEDLRDSTTTTSFTVTTPGGETLTCAFAESEAPLEVAPVVARTSYEDEDYLATVVHLIEV